VTGTTNNGVITSTNGTAGFVQSNLLFDGTLLTIKGNLSASGAFTSSLREGYVLVGGRGNVTTLVATSSFGGGTTTTDGIFRATGSIVATTNNIQITGSLDITGPVTASLRTGYVWVGHNSRSTRQVATSSFGATLTVEDGNPTIVPSVTKIVFSGASVTDNGSGQITVSITGGGGGGTSGTSGTSGVSGAPGTSGTSGIRGTDGKDGTMGTSGTSGITGGTSSAGSSGTSGTSGTSGVNGIGSSGTSGINGSSGTSGANGLGEAGSSGSSGTSGTSGITGNGATGGTSGTSGTSGNLTLSGTTNDGILTFDGGLVQGIVESDFTFNASSKILTVSGSVLAYTSVTLRPVDTLPAGAVGKLASYAPISPASASLYFHNGSDWVKVV
jgi:hypothetical protein